MKILYNQSQLKRSLIIGIAFTCLGAFSLLTDAKVYLAGLGGVGICYILNYLYLNNRAYVTITDDVIVKDGITNSIILKSDITSVRYFAGDYIITAGVKKMVIDTNLVDKTFLPELKLRFEELQSALLAT